MTDDDPTPDRLLSCTDCGLLYLSASPPAECACGCPDLSPVGYTELVDAALAESDVMDDADDPFQSGSEVPDGEECPNCGAVVDPDDVTHYLGGGECPECSE